MLNPVVEYYNRIESVPIEEQEIVASLVEFRKVKKKEILYEQGDTELISLMILKGCMRVYITGANGEEYNRFFAFEDWWVGDLYQLLHNLPSISSVQALEDCEIAVITKESYLKIFDTCPVFTRLTHMAVSRGYTVLLKKEQEKQIKSAEELYSELLEKHPDITKRISIKHIASYIGIQADSLSRIRRRLARK